MILLQDYAPVLSKLLKDQRLQEGASYRLMHFVVQQSVEEGLLLYNVLTRAVVLLSPEEGQMLEGNPSSIPKLISKWFVVPLDHDDRKLAKEVRAVGKMLEKKHKGISGYTILTTTDHEGGDGREGGSVHYQKCSGWKGFTPLVWWGAPL